MTELGNLAFSGPSGAGKTTLAKKLVETSRFSSDKNFRVARSVAHDVFKRYGYGQDDNMTSLERLYLQRQILEKQIDVYESQSAEGVIISDRTPMDMAAYVKTRIPIGHDRHIDREVEAYVSLCASVTGRFFKKIIFVPMCIPYESSEKRPSNVTETTIFSGVLEGIMNRYGVPYLKMPEIDGVNSRLMWVDKNVGYLGYGE